MTDTLTDLDAGGLLAASSGAVRERRLAEVRDLEVLSQWAAIHSSDPTEGPDARAARRVGNVLVHLGGEGTPGVQDFCLGEIALARGTGVTATTHALADVLDLQHRLPTMWAVVRAGDAEVYIARRVARLSRHLSADCVGVVDTAVARIIAHESGGRVLAVAEAKIIEADPALHDERVEAERARRYVGMGRTDEFGLRTVIARIEAGDAVWVEATIVRVAEILAPAHPHAHVDELRAIAFGFLARPAELLQLLLEHNSEGPSGEEDDDDGASGEDVPSRATAFPADLLDALRSADLSALASKAVLYVHLHEAALRGADAVARVEGLGAVSVSALAGLLARTRLTVRPVRDLSSRVRSTAYEHPESLKEQTYLRTGGDYWPYATSTSRHVDYDHPTPYVHRAWSRPPPGQTGSHNSGPLGRRHHRWKTHSGFRSRQCGEGRYVWLTPHGMAFLVDHLGTRRIEAVEALAMFEAPAGVDLYFT